MQLNVKSIQIIALAISTTPFLISCSTTGGGTASALERNQSTGLPIHGNFCGPGLPATTSPSPNGQILELQRVIPIDSIDRACQSHDICYVQRGIGNAQCDLELIDTMGNLVWQNQRSSTSQSAGNSNTKPTKSSIQCDGLALAIIGYFETSNPSAVKNWGDRLVGNTATHIAMGYTGAGLKIQEYWFKTFFLVYYPVIWLISNGKTSETNKLYSDMYSKLDYGMYADRWDKCN
jgi:hypothetical protein